MIRMPGSVKMTVCFPRWVRHGPGCPEQHGTWLTPAPQPPLMLDLELDLGLSIGGKTKGAERGWGGPREWREFPSRILRSRNPFYLCPWLWFARIKIKGITVGRAMTNARLSLVKPSISPSLRQLSRLQVGAHARSSSVCVQGAPSWQGRGGLKPIEIPYREVSAGGSHVPCDYNSDNFVGKWEAQNDHGAKSCQRKRTVYFLVKSNCLDWSIFY